MTLLFECMTVNQIDVRHGPAIAQIKHFENIYHDNSLELTANLVSKSFVLSIKNNYQSD